MEAANTQAYYDAAIITAVKSLIEWCKGSMLKNFLGS
jgi:hypothetical protein